MTYEETDNSCDGCGADDARNCTCDEYEDDEYESDPDTDSLTAGA